MNANIKQKYVHTYVYQKLLLSYYLNFLNIFRKLLLFSVNFLNFTKKNFIKKNFKYFIFFSFWFL